MADNKDLKFETSHIITMFPTIVWQMILKEEISTEINGNILKKLEELTRPLDGATFSQSWQSNQNLHEFDEFKPLIDIIEVSLEGALEYLKIIHQGYEITGCWANINSKSAAHKVHSHPNNFLSGVYYIQTQKGADTINFHDPRVQTGIFRPPVSQLTRENTDQVVVRVENGMLLLFPSWLEHSVDPNNSEQKRISVSFNIMFSSYTQTMSKPLW